MTKDFEKEEIRRSYDADLSPQNKEEERRPEDHDFATEPSERTLSEGTANDPEQASHPQPKDADLLPDVPPDGKYGWVIVGSSFMINAHTCKYLFKFS